MRTMRDLRLLPLVALLAILPLAACETQPEQETDELTTDAGVELSTDVPGPTAGDEGLSALALLEGPNGESYGEVRFTREGNQVRVTADLQGLEGVSPGQHGFHVHENGQCDEPTFESAGGHFNPEGVDHACPPTTPRHAGDLGNIEVAEDGTASLDVTSDLISLDGAATNSVMGKAVLLHQHEDDCSTQPTGEAGGRLACGVIAMSNPTAVDTLEVEGTMPAAGETDAGEDY
ncbi:MAG TPA: superoxide dismutase family protein [Thermoanaerobaculia bacterium]|nr:superoxide dismutase family protein [Thermoanaerobaculia bacterium]